MPGTGVPSIAGFPVRGSRFGVLSSELLWRSSFVRLRITKLRTPDGKPQTGEPAIRPSDVSPHRHPIVNSSTPPKPLEMSHALIVDLARNAIMLALLVAGPMLVVALLVGLTVSVLQAVTQIQEQTLAFLPKLVGVAAVFLLALPWIIQLMVKYTTELFRSLPSLIS